MSRVILLGATCGILAAVAIITLGCDKAEGEKARPRFVTTLWVNSTVRLKKVLLAKETLINADSLLRSMRTEIV